MFRPMTILRGSSLLALSLTLAACGGGGDTGVTTTPAPNTSTTPTTPTTTPTPTINYDTAEYRRSNGASYIKAISAWDKGSTGKGITVGIIDTGIDTSSAEFTGRIHSNSLDTVGSRGIKDTDGHGTSVAGVLAAARNDTKIMGVAFDSTLFIARADTAGSCSATDGCSFDDRNIAAGMNAAIANGAKVINLSLGGDGISNTLRTALQSAARAGAVVVVSAGNFKDGQDANVKLNPSGFAQAIVQTINGQAIIAGAVDSSGAITNFSYQAGDFGAAYVATLGSGVRSFNHEGVEYYYSGTSYAAPGVSGAAALLFQAFPNLTAQQVVELLLSSTDDAGASGTDRIYGRGILNIARAFSPVGTASLAGTAIPVNSANSSSSGTAWGASAGMAQALRDVVILDGYQRAFTADLSPYIQPQRDARWLEWALRPGSNQDAQRFGPAHFQFNFSPALISQDARADSLSGHYAPARLQQSQMLLAPTDMMQWGFAHGDAAALEEALGLDQGPRNSLRASFTDLPSATRMGAQNAVATALHWGAWQLGLSHDSAATQNRRLQQSALHILHRPRWAQGALTLGLTARMAEESGALLGTRSPQLLGLDNGRHQYLSAHAAFENDGWAVCGQFTQGWSHATPQGGVVSHLSDVRSQSWALDLSRTGLLRRDDALHFSVSQPLRITQGTAWLNLPTSYDYATQSARFSLRSASLVPQGQERDWEVSYTLPTARGHFSSYFLLRTSPDHRADAPDEKAVALRWSHPF